MQYIAKLKNSNLKVYDKNKRLLLNKTFKNRDEAIKYWDKFQKNNK